MRWLGSRNNIIAATLGYELHTVAIDSDAEQCRSAVLSDTLKHKTESYLFWRPCCTVHRLQNKYKHEEEYWADNSNTYLGAAH